MSSENNLGTKSLLVAWLGSALIAGSTAYVVTRTGGQANVRDYILTNPEIIREAAAALQTKEMMAKVGPLLKKIEAPFPGAEAGNPKGDIKLVEFTDYGCGYCRSSIADVERLVAEDKNIHLVYRELPILSPASREAALWALAAAKQGKHAAYHKAMFEGDPPSPESINAAVEAAGLDKAAAKAFVLSPEAEKELDTNIAISQNAGFGGTPTFIIGDQIVDGARGYDALKAAVAQARKSKKA